MATKAPFVVQQNLTAITLAYRNASLIADLVLPRYPVATKTFKYTSLTKEDGFTIPDTRVGRKSQVNEIDWTATESSASCADYGLEDAIPSEDIAAAQAAPDVFGVRPVDPMARSTELLTDLIALDREQRVANLVFAAGTYPAGNKATLSGTGQWSDYTNSDPLTAILTAFDTMMVRPNKLVLGQAVWTKLRMHPKITAAAFPAGGNAGTAPTVVARQAIAELLEIDEIIIGQSWVNTAKKGQTASIARLWGKSALAYYQAPVPTGPEGGLTFGLTAEWNTRVSGTIDNDPDVGLRGGTRVRVGESVKELVLASDVAYLWSAAVA